MMIMNHPLQTWRGEFLQSRWSIATVCDYLYRKSLIADLGKWRGRILHRTIGTGESTSTRISLLRGARLRRIEQIDWHGACILQMWLVKYTFNPYRRLRRARARTRGSLLRLYGSIKVARHGRCDSQSTSRERISMGERTRRRIDAMQCRSRWINRLQPVDQSIATKEAPCDDLESNGTISVQSSHARP
jgi:hypothetical protein